MTATYGMCFFAVSVLLLIVAFFFSRQVIGLEMGAFLKRQSKRAAAVLALVLPAFASAQTEHGGGGEANLTLPDLSSVNFFGMNGHALLTIRIAVLRGRPAVWPDDLHAVEETAGSSHDARNFGDDL